MLRGGGAQSPPAPPVPVVSTPTRASPAPGSLNLQEQPADVHMHAETSTYIGLGDTLYILKKGYKLVYVAMKKLLIYNVYKTLAMLTLRQITTTYTSVSAMKLAVLL